jgi:outer membrane protein OmpA-like peptidoglycan-associated protein
MKSKPILIVAALSAALVTACASTPKDIQELDAARTQVRQALSDPLAQEAAGMRLKKAEEALRLADQSHAAHRPLPEVQRYAYTATRHAQIAIEQTSELHARKTVEQGEAERTRIQLAARSNEAAKARSAMLVANDAASTARAAAAQAQQETARAEVATTVAQADTARANSDADRAKDEAERARIEAERANNSAAIAGGEAARLRAELEGLQAKQTDRGMVLTLGDVLFNSGRSELRPAALRTVERLADFMQQRAKLSVLIEGHTDNVGADAYNVNLSQQRADSVSSVLGARGIGSQRVRSHGLGESYPSASNDSAGGRQQNRRVEIVFSDENGQFAPSAERLTVR